LTTVVLLVLAMIWAAVLIVPLVRARTDGTLGDSVGTFRRQITVLERAAPGTVKPANRLRGPVAASIPPYRPPAAVRQQARLASAPSRPLRSQDAYSATRRRQAQKRRRDVLFALLAGMASSLMLGLIPGLHAMLYVHILLDVLCVSYIALLVRMRANAAPGMRLSYLPPPVPARDRSLRPASAGAARRVYREAEFQSGAPSYADAQAMLMRGNARQHWAS
jgi:hypothetical protein